ncbi:hypothetical protein Tco_0095972 [Tanacetum coccineum]
MSAMDNSTPVITIVRNTDGREKTPRETDNAPQASIQEFYEKHYDDILPIIIEKAHQDKRKGAAPESEATSVCGVKESYGEDRSRNNDHHRGMKKNRVNESPSSRTSVSSSCHGTHQRPRRRHESTDEEDLAIPWTCEDVDPITPRIRNFRSSRKT